MELLVLDMNDMTPDVNNGVGLEEQVIKLAKTDFGTEVGEVLIYFKLF